MKFLRTLTALLLSALLHTQPAIAWSHGNSANGIACPSGGPTFPGLSCNATGFTAFIPGSSGSGVFCEGIGCTAVATTTTIIYVCPSSGAVGCTTGVDGLSCGTWAAPCATASYAYTHGMRSGSPDWLLLAKNNTWAPDRVITSNTGLSLASPQLVSSFDPAASHNPPLPNPPTGGARPVWRVSAATGNGFQVQGGGSAGNYMAVVGIEFYAKDRDPGGGSFSLADSQSLSDAGVTVLGTSQGFLIEDCEFAYTNANAMDLETGDNTFQGEFQNIFIRRNVVLNTYSQSGGGTAGILTGPVGNGPNGFVFFENLFYHNGYNNTPPITWTPARGFSHNYYINGTQPNGDNTLPIGKPPSMTGNIVAYDPASPQNRNNGVISDSLYIRNPFDIAFLTTTSFNGSVTRSVFTNGIPSATSGVAGIDVGTRYVNEVANAGSISFTNNAFTVSPWAPSSTALTLEQGANGNSATGNVFYNWGFGSPSTAFVKSTGSLYAVSVSNGGSSYTDCSQPINSAALPAAGAIQDVVLTLGSSVAACAGGGQIPPGTGACGGQGCSVFYTWVYVTGGSTHGIPDGVYSAVSATAPTMVGGGAGATNTLLIYGTTGWDHTTFTGTVYFPWWNVPVTCTAGGATCGSPTGGHVDLISKGGVIVWVGLTGADVPNGSVTLPGQGFVQNNHLTATPQAGVNDGISSNFAGGTGSGLVLNVDAIAVNTIGADGCTLATQNDISDADGTNHCAFIDPNRTVGGYYSTLAGATANSTFTGVVASSVLTVSGWSGAPIQMGDAIKWSGQTKSDYIKFNSGGTIATVGSLSATPCTASLPNGCSANLFTGIALTNGSGTGATGNFAVDNGIVTGWQLSGTGQNYAANDVLHVAPTSLGGTAGGNVNFAVTVTSVSGGGTTPANFITGVSAPTITACSASPLGCTNNTTHTYSSVVSSGGYGELFSPAVLNVTVTDNGGTSMSVSAVTLASGGALYVLNDLLTTAASNIGGLSFNGLQGASNFTVQAATFTPSGTSCNGSACTGTGGNGTYGLTGINPTQSSIAMSSYSDNQFLVAAQGQSAATWDPLKTACKAITYIMAGFGITDNCTP